LPQKINFVLSSVIAVCIFFTGCEHTVDKVVFDPPVTSPSNEPRLNFTQTELDSMMKNFIVPFEKVDEDSLDFPLFHEPLSLWVYSQKLIDWRVVTTALNDSVYWTEHFFHLDGEIKWPEISFWFLNFIEEIYGVKKLTPVSERLKKHFDNNPDFNSQDSYVGYKIQHSDTTLAEILLAGMLGDNVLYIFVCTNLGSAWWDDLRGISKNKQERIFEILKPLRTAKLRNGAS
jgi:hypothetical protein